MTREQLGQFKVGDAVYTLHHGRLIIYRIDDHYVCCQNSTGSRGYNFGIQHFHSWVQKHIPAEKVRKYAPRQQKQYAFERSDGGRDRIESNDCTVRALALALDMPYAEAHGLMKQYGRQDGKGVSSGLIYRHIRYQGKKLVCAAQSYPAQGKGIKMTVGAWLKSGILPDRCILQITGHVFAVVGGVVRDSWKPGPRSIVHAVWEVVLE